MARSGNKALYRSVRYSPWTEWLQNSLRPEKAVAFDEIDLRVEAGPGDIIIDAGANVGDVTSRCARTGATVFAFEPHPECYLILKRRFAHLDNVEVLNRGVMSKAGTLELSTPLAHGEYDSLETTIAASFVAPDGDVPQATVEVECIDLAEFIGGLDKPVKLLKMDIEGAEVEVLNHLIDTGAIDRVDLAVIETHERLSPELAEGTRCLRERISERGLDKKLRLDWI